MVPQACRNAWGQITEDPSHSTCACSRTRKSKHTSYPHRALETTLAHLISTEALEISIEDTIFPFCSW